MFPQDFNPFSHDPIRPEGAGDIVSQSAHVLHVLIVLMSGINVLMSGINVLSVTMSSCHVLSALMSGINVLIVLMSSCYVLSVLMYDCHVRSMLVSGIGVSVCSCAAITC